MLVIKSTKAKKILSLPTDFKEVTKEILEEMVANIKVAPNYAVIALLASERLDAVCQMTKNRSEKASTIVPLLVKINDSDKDYFDKNSFNINDRVMIAKTDIEMALHLSVPNNPWSLSHVVDFCNSDDELVKSITEYRLYKLPENNPEYSMNGGFKSVVVKKNIFVNFKIVPINAIQAAYSREDFEGKPSKFIKNISSLEVN